MRFWRTPFYCPIAWKALAVRDGLTFDSISNADTRLTSPSLLLEESCQFNHSQVWDPLFHHLNREVSFYSTSQPCLALSPVVHRWHDPCGMPPSNRYRC